MKPRYHYNIIVFLFGIALFLSIAPVQAQDATEQKYNTIMQYTISERPLLAQLLTSAGLAPALSGNTPYTLLAPPEESLRSLKDAPAEHVRTVMARHLIKGSYHATDFKEGAQVETYSGEKLSVCRKKGINLLNGVKLLTTERETGNGMVLELEGML